MKIRINDYEDRKMVAGILVANGYSLKQVSEVTKGEKTRLPNWFLEIQDKTSEIEEE